MRISELPTPRLRARAYELAYPKNDTEYFRWRATREGYEFWYACHNRDWDKAKELQPDLFKPMDGKPHIKIHRVSGLIVVNYPVLVMTPNLKLVYKYIQEVSPREDYTTIQEAVDALYSYRRN